MTDEFAQAHDDYHASKVIVQTPPQPAMAMPSETETPAPTAPEATEKQLLLDPKFAAAAREVYMLFEGKPFDGDDKMAARYGIDAIGEFNYNFAGGTYMPNATGAPGTIQAAALLTSGTQDQAKAFVYLMDRYDQLPNFTLNGTVRMLRGLIADPSVYTGFGTLGAGFVARKTGAVGIKKLLAEIAKRPGTSAAVYTGIEAGAADQLTQGIEKQAGYEIDPVTGAIRTGVSAVVGGLAGGGTIKAGEAIARELAPAVQRGLTQLGEDAEARMAERGPMTDRLMSGGDPMDVIDPLLAGLGRIARSEQPTTGLSQASDEPGIGGLAPEYRVTVDAFEPEGTGKQSMVPIKLTPANAEKVKPAMAQIEQEFPDPLASPQAYATMVAKMQNKKEVSMPPSWMIEHANNPEKWADWFGQITPDQVKAADEGLAVQQKFRDAYDAGAGPELTGQLMLWTILSRMLSAFPHESGYLELADAAQPFIQKAARGEWSDADTTAWREMAMTIQPEDAAGRGATSNANAFGETFLRKMSAVDENGVSALTRLHNLIADPNKSSKEIRREYYSLAEGTGIGNKILSFALLVSGRNDVVVLDRIQINQMWGGGDKIYDDIMKQFEGAQGLVQYEALERSLMNRVPDLYQRIGRGDVGSVGRYHWESWVRSSGQIVAHPTLEAVVGMGSKRPGANISPTELMPVTEGRFHTKYSGVSYEKLPGGGRRYLYSTSDGQPYQFTKKQLDDMFKQAFSKKSGVLPADFPGVKAFEGGNIPWYEFEGVNRGKLDQLIRAKGKPAEQY